jgi:hypothetical protein
VHRAVGVEANDPARPRDRSVAHEDPRLDDAR